MRPSSRARDNVGIGCFAPTDAATKYALCAGAPRWYNYRPKDRG